MSLLKFPIKISKNNLIIALLESLYLFIYQELCPYSLKSLDFVFSYHLKRRLLIFWLKIFEANDFCSLRKFLESFL